MARKAPSGYFTKDGKDYLVLDSAKFADGGEVLTKAKSAARWETAVLYREVTPGSPTYVVEQDEFLDGGFKQTSREDVIERTQAAERAESERLAAEAGDEDSAS